MPASEYRRRMEILPQLQLRGRKVWLVGAVGEMLRLERERLVAVAVGGIG
jgi:hypothetical protein